MGLDGVELVMEIEDVFEICIPDQDAENMITPGAVVEYVYARVGSEGTSACLEQRAFYRLRRACVTTFESPRRAVNPSTRWQEVLPDRQLRHNWGLLHKATGTPQWPRLRFGRIPKRVATVGATAQYLAKRGPMALLKEGEGWTRGAIEATVKQLVCNQLGITEFRWDDEFVRDLGLD